MAESIFFSAVGGDFVCVDSPFRDLYKGGKVIIY